MISQTHLQWKEALVTNPDIHKIGQLLSDSRLMTRKASGNDSLHLMPYVCPVKQVLFCFYTFGKKIAFQQLNTPAIYLAFVPPAAKIDHTGDSYLAFLCILLGLFWEFRQKGNAVWGGRPSLIMQLITKPLGA